MILDGQHRSRWSQSEWIFCQDTRRLIKDEDDDGNGFFSSRSTLYRERLQAKRASLNLFDELLRKNCRAIEARKSWWSSMGDRSRETWPKSNT